MDRIIVKPLKEVNGVNFGMKRSEVRAVFGEAKEFKKSKFSKNTTDDFGFCHVFYDLNDQCEAVEIFEGVEIEVNGQLVFPIAIDKAKTIFTDLVEEDGSYISKISSVGIYAPSLKMESILFGNEGYYD